MARKLHRIIETSFGEVMVKPNEDTECLLDCYIGDNYDQFLGHIEGTLYEDDESFRISIENELI